MRYTVEQQGEKWVASNGTDHVEADEPSEALYRLVSGELEAEEGLAESVADVAEQRSAEEFERRVGHYAVQLIRLLAIPAPALVLRNEVEQIRRNVDGFISASNLEE